MELLASRRLTLGLLGSLLLQALLLEELLATKGLCIWVKTEEDGLVDEGVLLLCPGAFGVLLVGGADGGLDLSAINQAGHVGVGDLGGGKDIVLLVDSDLVECAVNFIKEGKRTLCPDNEPTKVTTRSKLEKVESPDVHELNTGEVTECLDDTVVLVVNNKGTTALTVPTVPELALAGTQLAGVGDLDDVDVCVERFEEGDSFFCLLEGLGSRGDDEGDFLDLLDAVATGKDEGGDCGRGESGDGGETALVLVDLDVPFAPGLGGRKHTSATAHVSECSLTGTVGSSATNTGNTSYSTTSTPGLGASLMASLLADDISLPLVFSDAFVNLRDNIEPDGGGEDGGKGERAGCLPRGGSNVNCGS